MKRTDLNSEERTFLELIAMNVWQARRQGAIVGAAYVLGVGLLLYLIMDVGPLDPVSSFLYAGIAVMTFLLWQRFLGSRDGNLIWV